MALAFAAPAHAGPLGLDACGPSEGVWVCTGLVATWDGVPLDTAVVLPRPGARDLPLVTNIPGFGNSRHEYMQPGDSAYTGNVFEWAREGYAVLAYTARGLWGSCGTPEARAASPEPCASGYIHLADARYEGRDTQELIGRLVDEGVADPARLGVTGDSYGGGQALMLAALRDRVMQPDGSLAPWRSPGGTPLSLAAAAPVIPWSDLMGAIAPNGRTLTTGQTGSRAVRDPVGVFKTSFANGIAAAAQFATGPGQPVGEPFVPGRPMGYLAPPGTDPAADVLGWVARADAGEPYDDPRTQAIIDELERHRSAFRFDSSTPPPPLLIGSGFTDDLFPVSEAVRYVNKVRAEHPDVPVSLVLGDFGHQRSSQKPAARAQLLAAIHAWFDHHLEGEGEPPRTGAVATTQTCPRDAQPGGPYLAASYAALAPGSVRAVFEEPQRVTSTGGNPRTALAIDPAAAGNACATVPGETASGTANYVFDPGDTTLLGAPAISARLTVDGSAAQLAGRLWDVAPDGTQTLVARGLYRPVAGAQSWELFPGGWHFAAGHRAKLELTGSDAPFGRASNGTFTVTVERLEVRLPVRERTGAAGNRLRVRMRCRGRRVRVRVAAPGLERVRLRAGRRVARDRRRPFARVLPRRRRVRIRATLATGQVLRASRRMPRCR